MTFAGKKLTVEPFRNPQKIIPICIQYDTTDANFELTVHVYDLVTSLGVVFTHYFLLFFLYRGKWMLRLCGDVTLPTKVIKHNQNFIQEDQPIRLQYSTQIKLFIIKTKVKLPQTLPDFHYPVSCSQRIVNYFALQSFDYDVGYSKNMSWLSLIKYWMWPCI